MQSIPCVFIIIFSFILFISPDAFSKEIVGRVVGVSDGDTLTVLTDATETVKVRLAEIDTPESGQPYGARAKQALSDLVFGHRVRVVVQDTDRYGRIVGRVHVGRRDINAELVRDGAAWVYRRYNRDPALLVLEQEARRARRGLWALPESERMPPWEWRSSERVSRSERAAAFVCTPRRTCAEMTSCAEAEFHLRECGNTRLDGNGDGIPCEALCRR